MDPTAHARHPVGDAPSEHEAEALVEALSRLRGRRGHRGGLPHEPGHRFEQGRRLEQGHRFEPGPHGARERTGGTGGAGGRGGPALLRLLGTLVRAQTSLSVSELAEHIGVDQPRASRLVQQAVELGHAVREADPEDARRTRVRVTDSGAQLVHGVRGRQREHASTALAGLSPQERRELLRLMGKLADAWPED